MGNLKKRLVNNSRLYIQVCKPVSLILKETTSTLHPSESLHFYTFGNNIAVALLLEGKLVTYREWGCVLGQDKFTMLLDWSLGHLYSALPHNDVLSVMITYDDVIKVSILDLAFTYVHILLLLLQCYICTAILQITKSSLLLHCKKQLWPKNVWLPMSIHFLVTTVYCTAKNSCDQKMYGHR